ncbi:MAG TPA: hypothetical protein PKH43_14780, partial [Saprospiraceae bacterium]|nr:hypothetical protein [Saprospiraceae bacterium]
MRKNLIIALIAFACASLTAQTPSSGTGNLTPASSKTTKTNSAQPRSGSNNTAAAKSTRLAPAKPAGTAPSGTYHARFDRDLY